MNDFQELQLTPWEKSLADKLYLPEVMGWQMGLFLAINDRGERVIVLANSIDNQDGLLIVPIARLLTQEEARALINPETGERMMHKEMDSE